MENASDNATGTGKKLTKQGLPATTRTGRPLESASSAIYRRGSIYNLSKSVSRTPLQSPSDWLHGGVYLGTNTRRLARIENQLSSPALYALQNTTVPHPPDAATGEKGCREPRPGALDERVIKHHLHHGTVDLGNSAFVPKPVSNSSALLKCRSDHEIRIQGAV